MAVFLADRHEHPRHQREVERHVAFVAVAEVRADVGRPLVRLGEQHAVGKLLDRARRRIFFRMSCVSGRFSQIVPSRSIRYGTASSRRPSTPRSSQKRITLVTASSTAGIVEVQVRLMVEEAMPVVGLRGSSQVQFDVSVSVKMIRTPSYFRLVSLQT